MSGKRTRKPVQKLGDFEDSSEVLSASGSIDMGSAKGGGGSSKVRAGRANKKRDDRSALVEVWMCKNESGNKPSTEIKAKYGELLKIPKEKFWDTMKEYALKSKLSCVPDFEQIWHHMKDDKAELLTDLHVQGLDYWWEQEVGKNGTVYYRPNTQNLKNFKPASGILHHFYQTYIYDQDKYDEVRQNPRATSRSGRYRIDPEELDDLVAKLSPFCILPEPKALLVLPNSADPVHKTLQGTYALSKKVNGFNVFVRPARQVTKGKGAAFHSVVVNGSSVDVPEGKAENYATVENGLALLCKEDKTKDDESEVFLQVPFRMRVPPTGVGKGGNSAQMLEAVIEDLGEAMFDFTPEMGVMVYPVRGLLPIPEIMRFIDFGAVWHGCFSPFPRTAASFQEFVAHFDAFPEPCLKFFFRAAVGGNDVLADEYIRFMTWFANFDDGLGFACCNARALRQALEGLPFYLSSQSEELRASRQVGAYALRLSDSKPQCLTVEVLQQASDEDEDGGAAGGTVLCYRVRVAFQHATGGAASKKAVATDVDGVVLPQVQFFLEEADGKTVVKGNKFHGPILKKIEAQAGLPVGTVLLPLLAGGADALLLLPDGLGKGSTGDSTSSTSSGRRRSMGPPPARGTRLPAAAAAVAVAKGGGGGGATASHKRKRAAVEDALPPPMSKMGTAGASSFNDSTFDIHGTKQLAASRVKRGVSNVGGGGGGGGDGGGGSVDLPPGVSGGSTASNAPLTMWGHHIPMPSVGRDHSLAPPPMMAANSLNGVPGLRQESLGKGDSWGSVLKNMEGLSPMGVGREHSLGLGLSGMSRDLSVGSLGDLPTLSRNVSQMSEGGGGGGGEEDGLALKTDDEAKDE